MGEPPPREAAKQPDGSYTLPQPDGSTLRWTRRLDGTWRKPEHKRAGYVGELEQKKYVVPGLQQQMQREEVIRREVAARPVRPVIPGLPPGAAVEPAPPRGRNERTKEQRKQKAELSEAARLGGYPAPTTSAAPATTARTRPAAGPRVPDAWEKEASDAPAAVAPSEAAARAKSHKALEKKLRQIVELEHRQAKGEALNEDQLLKIASKPAVEAEMHGLSAESLAEDLRQLGLEPRAK